MIDASKLIQYFDHDLLGSIPFKDLGAFDHKRDGTANRCHPRQIKLGVKMSPAESRETRAQIADDINLNEGAQQVGLRKGYRY